MGLAGGSVWQTGMLVGNTSPQESSLLAWDWGRNGWDWGPWIVPHGLSLEDWGSCVSLRHSVIFLSLCFPGFL